MSKSNEEILKEILEDDSFTKQDISDKLRERKLSEDRINLCLELLDNSKLFVNLDLMYSKKFNLKKKSSYEIVRYIVRKTKKDSEYGNFHNIEYKYIVGIIKNELIRMGVADKIINECLEYLKNNSDESYNGDRYKLKKR